MKFQVNIVVSEEGGADVSSRFIGQFATAEEANAHAAKVLEYVESEEHDLAVLDLEEKEG